MFTRARPLELLPLFVWKPCGVVGLTSSEGKRSPRWLTLPWLSAGNFGRCHVHSLRCPGTLGEGMYVNRLALSGIRDLFFIGAHCIVHCHQFCDGGQCMSASQPAFPRFKLDSSHNWAVSSLWANQPGALFCKSSESVLENIEFRCQSTRSVLEFGKPARISKMLVSREWCLHLSRITLKVGVPLTQSDFDFVVFNFPKVSSGAGDIHWRCQQIWKTGPPTKMVCSPCKSCNCIGRNLN